ncbi:glycosyltransferase family 9 protein [Myxococcota bacterium]|nr:glycosyltransferase family 9 protein [Myxococcota bacterium]
MGSIVLASPMLRRLREEYPGARIDFLTLSENTALLRLISDVDRRVTLDLGGGIARFLVSTVLTVWRLRGERYDLLFDLEFFTRFSALFSALVNPRRSHGFSAKGNWRGRLHDVEVPFNAYHHVALNFLTLMRRDPMDPIDDAEIRVETSLSRLEPDEQSWQACHQELLSDPAWREGRPIVVVNPNAGDMALERRWPLESVSVFLRDLCSQSSVNAVVTGSPAEADYVRAVVEASGVGDRIIDLSGRVDIPAFVALLGHADAVVTNDSGPLHLAAAAGASTVALFGPETPRLYGPLLSRVGQRHEVHYRHLACSPCMFVHDNKVLSCWFAQARCMTGISPAEVLHSVDALLAERESSDP